jgi:hypothetical protein
VTTHTEHPVFLNLTEGAASSRFSVRIQDFDTLAGSW